MSFQNSGVTPSGREFFRGESILVLHVSHLLTARICEISESDGEIFVTANVDTGVLNSMGGDPAGKKVPPVEYVGTGFRHQSTRLVRGKAGTSKGMRVFCFANETPNFAMGDAPGTAAPTIPVEAAAPDSVGTNDPFKTAPLPTPVAERTFDPADRNRDGKVTPKEQRQHEREQRND